MIYLCNIIDEFIFQVSADSPENHRFIGEAEKKYIIKETEKTIALRKFCATVILKYNSSTLYLYIALLIIK